MQRLSERRGVDAADCAFRFVGSRPATALLAREVESAREAVAAAEGESRNAREKRVAATAEPGARDRWHDEALPDIARRHNRDASHGGD